MTTPRYNWQWARRLRLQGLLPGSGAPTSRGSYSPGLQPLLARLQELKDEMDRIDERIRTEAEGGAGSHPLAANAPDERRGTAAALMERADLLASSCVVAPCCRMWAASAMRTLAQELEGEEAPDMRPQPSGLSALFARWETEHFDDLDVEILDRALDELFDEGGPTRERVSAACDAAEALARQTRTPTIQDGIRIGVDLVRKALED